MECDVERGRTIEWSLPANPIFDGLALDQFHRIKVFAPLTAKVKHRCDVAVAKLCCSTCLGQETRAAGVVRQVTGMNHFKGNLATQIRIERLVGHTHGAAAEFYRHAIFVSDQLILVEAKRFGGEIDIFVTKSSMQ